MRCSHLRRVWTPWEQSSTHPGAHTGTFQLAVYPGAQSLGPLLRALTSIYSAQKGFQTLSRGARASPYAAQSPPASWLPDHSLHVLAGSAAVRLLPLAAQGAVVCVSPPPADQAPFHVFTEPVSILWINVVLFPLVSLLTGRCSGLLRRLRNQGASSTGLLGKNTFLSSPASRHVAPGVADLRSCGLGEAWAGTASEHLGDPVVLGPLPQVELPSCSFVPGPA